MLRTLRIRDFVIVDELTVEFGDGLNLLTGETGAGKSIVLDALGMAVGLRADRSWIRAGSERAVVEALFEFAAGEAAPRCAAERGVEVADGGQILVQRELPAGGGGRVWINGAPGTVQLLRDLGPWLVELHGQREPAGPSVPERQTAIVDERGGQGELVAAVRRAHGSVREADERREHLVRQAARRAERVEELERVAREIEAAQPRAGEIAELERDALLLRNAERVACLLEEIVQAAYEGEPSAAGLAAAAAGRAEELARIDPALGPAAQQLRAAALELQDAGTTFRDWRERAAFEPERLEGIEARRAALERLCLRHATDEAGLAARAAAARRELDELRSLDAELERLELESAAARRAYAEAATALGAARRKAARRIGREVQEQLSALALPHARFEIAFRPARGPSIGNAGPELPFSPAGAERAEFLWAANPGEPAQPLARAASGGEWSRVMLALHVVADSTEAAPTVIFDEIDAGVGGAAADAVGARLAQLARRRQVLCVTHLPQVAAYADRHLRVRKEVRGGRTRAAVEDLAAAGRIEEMARMLGGRRPTAASRRHAAEMLGAAGRAPARRNA